MFSQETAPGLSVLAGALALSLPLPGRGAVPFRGRGTHAEATSFVAELVHDAAHTYVECLQRTLLFSAALQYKQL